MDHPSPTLTLLDHVRRQEVADRRGTLTHDEMLRMNAYFLSCRQVLASVPQRHTNVGIGSLGRHGSTELVHTCVYSERRRDGSWCNPGADMHDNSIDDYRTQGVMAATNAVQAICGPAKIHATGYCLGGTLLAIAAAAMAHDDNDRIASLSLFAAQTDFSEAGELQLFITEDQLAFLDDIMQTQDYLSSAQMGGAFQMLRSNDLIWSRAIRDYLLGERDAPFDLTAWDADGTRLPARMHIEYLRSLFLHNDLAEGRFQVDGHALALDDIKLPIFVVSTERDHIAPWHSVFKLHLLNDGPLTFVLTSGGHNAGIVSEPGHPHRRFRLRTRDTGGHTFGRDEWEQVTAPQDGSWWPEWNAWLGRQSGPPIAPPRMGLPGAAPLGDAPGTYVLEG
jgi:polyhydroxyalkanoate synthase